MGQETHAGQTLPIFCRSGSYFTRLVNIGSGDCPRESTSVAMERHDDESYGFAIFFFPIGEPIMRKLKFQYLTQISEIIMTTRKMIRI